MNKFNYKQLKITDWINLFALLLCVGGIVGSRIASVNSERFSSSQIEDIWYIEMMAITVSFILITNLKVRFYLVLATILTNINNWSLELFLKSSFSQITFLHYLFDIGIYYGNYLIFTYGPLLIGLFLRQTLKMNVGAGVFVSSTDYYIGLLHRVIIAFHSLVFIEYLIRHSNPIPNIYDTSNLLILYNLFPVAFPMYSALFYGLLAREALFSPKN